MKKEIYPIILILSLLFIHASVYGLSQAHDNAESAVINSRDDISEMSDAELPTLRVNDIYLELEQLFSAQTALEEKSNVSNYDNSIKMVDDISNIISIAYLTNDELFVLENSISALDPDTMDLTDINLCFVDAEQEFTDERFEQSLDIIDTCYEKISDAEATATRVQAMYKATTENLNNYLYRNRLNIIVSLILLLLIGLLVRSKITKLNLLRRLENLKKERHILKDLIRNAQNEYFQKGNLNETTYTIKVTKFSEMIRDINRQIPILMEEFERQH